MKNYPNSEKYGNRITKKNFIEVEERVRYSETDQMGVAHNKNYFEWFEIGRTEYCNQKNIPYKNIEARGYYLVVVEAYCKYKKPLRYDEKFIIRVSLEEITAKKVVFFLPSLGESCNEIKEIFLLSYRGTKLLKV